MIYFIAKPDRSRIKIGTTIRLSQRLKQLAAEHGDGLTVMAVADGNREAERGLHERFAHLRDAGEWFEPGDDLLGFILSDGREWDGSDEAPSQIAVKVDRTLIDKAKLVASRKGSTLAEYLTDLLRSPVERDFGKAIKELEGGGPK